VFANSILINIWSNLGVLQWVALEELATYHGIDSIEVSGPCQIYYAC